MKEENEGSLVDPVTKRPGFIFWLIWVFGSGAAFTILLLVGFPLSTAILGLLGYRGSAIDDGGPFMFYLTFSFALGGLGNRLSSVATHPQTTQDFRMVDGFLDHRYESGFGDLDIVRGCDLAGNQRIGS